MLLQSAGCSIAADNNSEAVQGNNSEAVQRLETELYQAEKPEKEQVQETASFDQPLEVGTLGNPGSSYGLGSAAFLQGRNLLVSLFVTTPESSWTEEEQKKTLEKLQIAAAYIEAQAKAYGTDTEMIFDWNSQNDLKAEARTDFLINEDTDFLERLDKEIAYWFDEKISYEELLEKYGAEGIATCVFVNNPGISYAIVYDGTDNVKESIILFSEDYYRQGQEETAAVYAHEILHVFGAHDLYQDAEFTGEVTDYVADIYPNEIMYSVSGSNEGTIEQTISPITAYHLGWLEDTEEVSMFPQLNRY